MKAKASSIIWGVLLIGVGLLFLAQNYGHIDVLSNQVWLYIFAGVSLLFFTGYFVGGVKNWGLLFPACIFGALALGFALTEAGAADEVFGSAVLLAIAIPFIVAFFLNMRQNWWALIPAWVMTVLSFVAVLSTSGNDDIIGSLVLFAIGLPFLVVFFLDRTRWWALIPGLIMLVLSPIPLIEARASGEFIGALVTAGMAIPFFAVYLNKREHWWALIPAGVFTSIAVTTLLTGAHIFDGRYSAFYGTVFFLGMATTFGVLWLLRSRHDTDWAKFPALGLAGTAVIVFIAGLQWIYVWPVLIVIAGAAVLYFGLRQKKLPPS
jgi:hypothetical protein